MLGVWRLGSLELQVVVERWWRRGGGGEVDSADRFLYIGDFSDAVLPFSRLCKAA